MRDRQFLESRMNDDNNNEQIEKKKIGPKGIWGEISIQINQNYVTQKLNMFYVKLNSSSAHWFLSLSFYRSSHFLHCFHQPDSVLLSI